MGVLLPFDPRHSRAPSLTVVAGAFSPNRDGSARSFSLSSAREKITKFSAGMSPRDFQLLTADMPTSASEAAADVPPKASTMASTDLSIPAGYSRFVNASSLHDMAVDLPRLLALNPPMAESLKSLGKRLESTREALGLSQAELCRAIKCRPNRWSQYESGERRITLPIANKLCDEFGLSLDWIYRANPAMLPYQVRIKIAATAA